MTGEKDARFAYTLALLNSENLRLLALKCEEMASESGGESGATLRELAEALKKRAERLDCSFLA